MNRKEKLEEIENLKEEGRFEDIFRKYGEREYKKILTFAMYSEIKEYRGNCKAKMWWMQQIIKKELRKFAVRLAFGITIMTAGNISYQSHATLGEIEKNAIIYEDEIEKYGQKISQYAEEVRKIGLEDIEIFMKVMYDMWENIQGYGNPQEDVCGFWELDLATLEGYGVCRNMASDVAKKLNAIDNNYNARIMSVITNGYENYEAADIKRNYINDELTEQVTEKEQSNMEQETKTRRHMVTLVDVLADNATLVLDPTNPGIGIYKNGKIKMFNAKKKNTFQFDAQELRTAILYEGGWNGIERVIKDYVQSFRKCRLSQKELEEKYALSAQNMALAKIKFLEEWQKQKACFEERIKVKGVPKGKVNQNSESFEIKQHTRNIWEK